MKVILKSKRNTHFAVGEYLDGKLTIKAGSRINLSTKYEKMSTRTIAARTNQN